MSKIHLVWIRTDTGSTRLVRAEGAGSSVLDDSYYDTQGRRLFGSMTNRVVTLMALLAEADGSGY